MQSWNALWYYLIQSEPPGTSMFMVIVLIYDLQLLQCGNVFWRLIGVTTTPPPHRRHRVLTVQMVITQFWNFLWFTHWETTMSHLVIAEIFRNGPYYHRTQGICVTLWDTENITTDSTVPQKVFGDGPQLKVSTNTHIHVHTQFVVVYVAEKSE